MFKSYLFASLYAVIGATSWGAYSMISNEDTSAQAIKQLAVGVSSSQRKENNPISNPLYRWKDHKGNWQYGQPILAKSSMAKFEKELEIMRSLPREVLPTQILKPFEQDNNNILSKLSRLYQMAGLQKPENLSQLKEGIPIKKLLDNAKKIAQQRRESMPEMMK